MGIANLQSFIRKHFKQHINKINTVDNFKVDNLVLDMNCIIHYSAQKVFRYGGFKDTYAPDSYPTDRKSLNKLLYRDVANIVQDIIDRVRPQKRLFIAIDGPAPIAKQNQQRQRRFKAAKDSALKKKGVFSMLLNDFINVQQRFPTFETSSITPGTEFLHNLSRYLQLWISQILTVKYPYLTITLANEKVPGEGEYKCYEYIRGLDDSKYNESFCVNGLDADLFMLSLGSLVHNFFIIRENLFEGKNILDPKKMIYDLFNIKLLRNDLLKMMREETNDVIEDNRYIYDFIIFSYFVGNDFLPSLPTVNIVDNSIELMIAINKQNVKDNPDNHLVLGKKLNVKSLSNFLISLSNYEKESLLRKHEKQFISIDEILERNMKGDKDVDLDNYKLQYLSSKFSDDAKTVSINYLNGIQFILSYYLFGDIDWNYFYPYSYSPFASTLVKYIGVYEERKHIETFPIPPFLQLLCVLPPTYSNLLPYPLNQIMLLEKFKKYYPDNFEVDYQGKKLEHEGVVILPYINIEEIKEVYRELLPLVPEGERRRNVIEKVITWK